MPSEPTTVERMGTYRDEIVDELVIRDDCPHEPCATNNGMKTRATVLVTAPAVLVMVALWAATGPIVTTAASLGTLAVMVRIVTERINEQIEQQECKIDD